MFNIEEQLKMLPDKPGVYIMRDVENKIIYVGIDKSPSNNSFVPS